MSTPTIDHADIQGIVIRSYKDLAEACYVMIDFADVKKSCKWLKSIINRITPASIKPQFALQIAFTSKGVSHFISDDQYVEPFSREFLEGMVTPERSRILGDLDTNDPVKWNWGQNNESIGGVLMFFAENVEILERNYRNIVDDFEIYNIQEVIRLNSQILPSGKEHFGFRDGVSQPLIRGLEKEEELSLQKASTLLQDKKVVMDNYINPGEFILGYENEYGQVPSYPTITNVIGDKLNIGLNGSYMVFRQMNQDVKTFWEYIYNQKQSNPSFKDKDAIYIASKLMGRWPNGNSLTDNPEEEGEVLPNDKINNFLYKSQDQFGFGCPIGSHVRKTNPRDGIDSDPDKSIQVSKRHRILRRGRTFGTPLSESLNLGKNNKEIDRGLYFICFNSNIGRQFEFIQQTWSNNGKFDDLYNDVDPITGVSFTKGKYVPCQFTIQSQPFRKSLKDIPQFVFIRGGAYFFVPGIKALEIIASIHSKY
ncbi:Dyp-type peroxidase [Siphonobacter sp. SORGH_AS_0500]|uniref:Dyp-type peroxidase n=1 Tax=Siphonobacter sp. SORGH_AS_0500 TaxID=1864824 RepID=UPI0012FF300E|nr:Dyp-type peroxidase [Siphonobacter sp. SORGH_AS_0500]